MPTKTFTQFRVDNVVTTLPTTLEYGQEVYYKDANGNLTLWVGHEDGTAWPACGYKEALFRIFNPPTNELTIYRSDFGSFTIENQSTGLYYIRNNAQLSGSTKIVFTFFNTIYSGGVQTATVAPVGGGPNANVFQIGTLVDGSFANIQATISIRLYP